ncbi:4Fe-4S dicluster domain-containing protein [candidate division KSB1 bacterium]|nr:4Fe-4S dicluster domain-containing protein [candidate division KSB1 bacterium]
MLAALLKFFTHARNAPAPLRPPGAVLEKEFVQRCIKCNKCAQVCPYGSIQMAHLHWGAGFGTPMIFARDMPCYVCMKCPPVCPTGALDNRLTQKENVRMGTAAIDTEKCLPYSGVICRACFERCPIYREAITLKDEIFPQVHEDKCLGCGICEHVCPAEEAAITVRARLE